MADRPVPETGETELAEAARRDAEEAKRQTEEYERTRPPSSIQRQMAGQVGEVMGVEIDPRSVRDLGYESPYYVGEVDVAGLTFVGHYLSDTNGLHRTSSPWTVRRKRRFGRKEKRQVNRIGDLEGWL